jgi:hypothetical protein
MMVYAGTHTKDYFTLPQGEATVVYFLSRAHHRIWLRLGSS